MDLKQPAERETHVVYGVYDSKSQPFAVRFEDFWIDRKRVKVQDKSYFFHLLAVMIDAGIPIMRALKLLSKKTENPRFARVVNTMAYDVERGKKMSQSMAKFPDVFLDSEIGVVKSAESIGTMSDLLFKLAEQTGRSHALLMKVRGALVYPVTVLIALMISGAIVVTTVIPRLKDFFEQGNVEMPFSTRLVLGVGNFFFSFGWFALIAALLVAVGLSFYVNSEMGRRKFDALLLRTVWVRDVVRKVNVARFVQLMSILVTAGVPIHEAIRIASEAMNNRLYKDFLNQLRHSVERGERIAENLEKAPFLFPETVSAMVGVGENSGSLGPVSEKLAKQYEQEVEHALENFTTVLEPVVIGIVGVAVGVLALALLGPIFSLSSLVA